jgi:hypothetical protein
MKGFQVNKLGPIGEYPVKIDPGEQLHRDAFPFFISAFRRCLPIADTIRANSARLFVKECRKEIKLRMLELKSLAALRDSAFSQDDRLPTPGEGVADDLPFFKAGRSGTHRALPYRGMPSMQGLPVRAPVDKDPAPMGFLEKFTTFLWKSSRFSNIFPSAA